MAKAIGRKLTEPAEKRDMERAGQESMFLGTECTFLVDNKCSTGRLSDPQWRCPAKAPRDLQDHCVQAR